MGRLVDPFTAQEFVADVTPSPPILSPYPSHPSSPPSTLYSPCAGYLISATLVLVVFAVIGTDSFAVNSVMAYVATFAAFGLCIIPYSYCFSFLFDKEQTAEKWLPNVTSFTVAIPWVLTSFALRNPSHGLNSAFSVVPVYGLYYLLASLEGGPKTGRGPYTAGMLSAVRGCGLCAVCVV